MGVAVRLSAELRTLLERWVRAGYPEETCGLLIGERGQEGLMIQHAVQAKNLNRERAQDRYELDPLDFLAAERKPASSIWKCSACGTRTPTTRHGLPKPTARPHGPNGRTSFFPSGVTVYRRSAHGA